MSSLQALRKKNPGMVIHHCEDPSFARYGRIIFGIDSAEFIRAAETGANPEAGVAYLASVPAVEAVPAMETIRRAVFKGEPIQGGWVRGSNSSLNAFEYHRSSEVIVAVTDLVLILGHTSHISGNIYDTSRAEIFFQPAGSTVELYATTLHFAPVQTGPDGFCAIIILPVGTNTPLDGPVNVHADGEERLLFMKNKWLLAFPGSVQEERGGYPGMKGSRITVAS